MKRNYTLNVLTFILAFLLSTTAHAKNENEETVKGLRQQALRIQLPFIQNIGQVNNDIAFYSPTKRATIFITRSGEIGYNLFFQDTPNEKYSVIRERFVDAFSFKTTGVEKQPLRVNYFKGKDPQKWLQAIPAYGELFMGEIYPGVFLSLTAGNENVEKVFRVAPGGQPEQILVNVNGAQSLEIEKDGTMKMRGKTGVLTFTQPVAYQQTEHGKVFVEAAYTLKKNGYGFKLGNYDPTREVIIDPLIVSTVMGGSSRDEAESIAVGPHGRIYIGGVCRSEDINTGTGSYDETINGSNDGFIAIFDKELEEMTHFTFIGGDKNDYFNSIHISASGNVYAGGYTQSEDLPVTINAFDGTFGGTISDAFIVKLDKDLENLLACTYIGGSNAWYDEIFFLTTDDNEHLFAAGNTRASNFPVIPSAYDTSYNGGETDAFIIKMDNTLQTLLASTFLGGSKTDWIYDMVFRDGDLYAAGKSYSSDLPTTSGAYDRNYDGDEDGFIALMDGNLTTLKALTYLNGDTHSEDMIYGMTLDSSGNVYVAGGTASKNFPTTAGAYCETYESGGHDVFVSRFSSDLKNLQASTLIGGSQNDFAFDIQIDASGGVCIAGYTYNPYSNGKYFPTTGSAYDTTYNGGTKDAFFSRFDKDLTQLLYSTFIGGSDLEEAHSLTIDGDGDVFVTGYTESIDFPVTEDAYQINITTDTRENAFISKFDISSSDDDIQDGGNTDGGSSSDNDDESDHGGGGGGGCFVATGMD